ncbi:tetratricopeptide repeat protein [Oscillatoriales cyanobacterium LEGE 11467]|uniref:non-specific serine/threonine protein kinase n=1 Tax=Zarconia navalis LEGE 11467 TaxID=1828826 RepID=A0A928Z8I1_9CYAN|nr:tetratricopeptide repeat protein [Zarconia navalis]MBE9040569.1 tetratricopeptide repeat protein [Zarconia navalis LEGE 11467]
MSHCLNPQCKKPQNPKDSRFCQSCGSPLRLGDRYRAFKPIAVGGFGRTFLAVDEYKPSQSLCVIKQFFPASAHAALPKAAELFRREASRLDELGKHPQIPELLAHFEQNQQLYLVQEWIDGRDLEEELNGNGVLEEGQIRDLLLQLLPGLQIVHDRQVIHRDIKPDNIIRRRSSPSQAELVLVDFGASKVMTANPSQQAGTTIGSAGYTAPEQLQGRAVRASDLYSLGVTCIRLLTGVSPFELFDATESRWRWRDYLTQPVSEPLGQLLDRLLQPSLSQRYPSAVDALQAVRNLPPPSPPNVTPPPANPSLFNRLLGGIPQAIVGQIAQEFGNANGALSFYDRAIAINPRNHKAWYKKGNLYVELDRTSDAIYCYRKTVEIQPNFAEAWYAFGRLSYKSQQYRQAVESYLKCLQFQPDRPGVWLCLGVAVSQLGEDREARQCLEKARQLLPDNIETRSRLLWEAWETLLK